MALQPFYTSSLEHLSYKFAFIHVFPASVINWPVSASSRACLCQLLSAGANPLSPLTGMGAALCPQDRYTEVAVLLLICLKK